MVLLLPELLRWEASPACVLSADTQTVSGSGETSHGRERSTLGSSDHFVPFDGQTAYSCTTVGNISEGFQGAKSQSE